jgi:hypothetical protein
MSAPRGTRRPFGSVTCAISRQGYTTGHRLAACRSRFPNRRGESPSGNHRARFGGRIRRGQTATLTHARLGTGVASNSLPDARCIGSDRCAGIDTSLEYWFVDSQFREGCARLRQLRGHQTRGQPLRPPSRIQGLRLQLRRARDCTACSEESAPCLSFPRLNRADPLA